MEKDVNTIVENTLNQLGDKVTPKVKKMVEKVITDIYDNGMSPLEAMQAKPELVEAIYQQGYMSFQSGKYQDALAIFSFLRTLDPDSYRYHFAIGACYQSLKEYSNAIANYLLASQADMTNPMPYFYIYDCFMKQDNIFSALRALVSVLLLTKDKPEYVDLRSKALIEYQNLQSKIKEHPLVKGAEA
jgi:type III secretion system low calcium response chaperone LcrH/SycD